MDLLLSYSWTDNRLNYSGNATSIKVPLWFEDKCGMKHCDHHDYRMLDPPVWIPSFQFHHHRQPKWIWHPFIQIDNVCTSEGAWRSQEPLGRPACMMQLL